MYRKLLVSNNPKICLNNAVENVEISFDEPETDQQSTAFATNLV